MIDAAKYLSLYILGGDNIIIYLPTKKYIINPKTKKFDSYLYLVKHEFDEVWKDFYFKGFKTGYKVSNLGRVEKPDGNMAKLYYDKDGYTRFCVYIPKGTNEFTKNKAIRYPYKTHRAVAELFIPNPNPEIYKIIMHKNDIPDCNIYLNLDWGTYQENMDDKLYSGHAKYLFGENKVEAKFTESQVRQICDCLYNLNITKSKDIIKYLGYDIKDESFLKSFKILIANIKKRHCWV